MILRVCCLPLVIKARRDSIKMANLSPQLVEIQKDVMAPNITRDESKINFSLQGREHKMTHSI